MNNYQLKTPLVTKLKALANKPHAPFYAPGHKGGRGINDNLKSLMGELIFKADLPELPGLDNLFVPENVIKESQKLASDAFGAQKTWFLINGSTCGIIASILATCRSGDKIILPRNIHQSAIFGLIISGAIPIFINPEYNPVFDLSYGLTPQAISQALEQHSDAKAVMVVYPTYHGVCSDLKAIAEVTHQDNIPLLVDEAHGAHFHFHPHLPPSALECGADLTVQSTHKVLGAMTQASMLHLQGSRIDADSLDKALQLVQSSSPSYLLLASLDAARQQMAIEGKQLLTHTLNLSKQAREKISKIEDLLVFNCHQSSAAFFNFDPTRLTVNVSPLGLTGYEADEIFHQYLGVIAELPSLTGLTFIISIGNTQADIDRLITGFKKLRGYQKTTQPTKYIIDPFQDYAVSYISPREAFLGKNDVLCLEESIGYICAEIICPYPPGIPILMPGEIITLEALEYLKEVIHFGAIISGCSDSTLKTIKVVQEN